MKRSTDPVVHREGGDPSHERKSPGKTKFDAVTLERGVTHDLAFEQWANLVHSLEAPISLKNFRKDIVVDVFNEADQKVLSYKIFRCWPSEYQALPALDAGDGGRGDPDPQARARGLGARHVGHRAHGDLAVGAGTLLRSLDGPPDELSQVLALLRPPASRSPRRSRSARATGGCSRCTAR